MNKTEEKDLFKLLNERQVLAFKSDPPDLTIIREIFTKIHRLNFNERIKYKDLYSEIGQKLFEKGIRLNEYNLSL